MEDTWLKYLTQRLLEDSDTGELDKNDPAVKAILKRPDILASFTKNPANLGKNTKDARQIVNRAMATNKDLTLVAKAANVARQGGLD